MEVFPVALTDVNWQTYIDSCIKSGVEPPTKRLDDAFLTERDLASFIASIAQGDLRNALRNTNHILRHASAGFIILTTPNVMMIIQSQSKLTVSSLGDDCFLVSGTIEDWKQAIVELSNKTTNSKVRYIINCCMLFLERGGLMEIFGNYSKETLPDKTFILIRKD